MNRKSEPTNARHCRPGKLKHLAASASFAVAAMLAASITAHAQAVTVDEGTFDVSLGGSAVGTEAFSIVRRGSGEDLQTLARGQIRLDLPQGTRTLQPLVRTVGAALEVTQYQLQTTGDNAREVRLDRSGERRMHATIITADGEREQEFRFESGAILLENRVAHHFHFLGTRLQAGATSVLIVLPAQRSHVRAEVTLVGNEPVTVAGTSVQGRRYSVSIGDQTGSVWFDEEWRVLRVEFGTDRYAAVRRELP